MAKIVNGRNGLRPCRVAGCYRNTGIGEAWCAAHKVMVEELQGHTPRELTERLRMAMDMVACIEAALSD